MDAIRKDDASACLVSYKFPCQEEREFPEGLATSVYVQYVDGDGFIWIMLKSDLETIESIFDALNTEISEKRISDLEVNEIVQVFDDNAWYRAVILKTEPDICARCIDFGNELVVRKENVAPLPLPLRRIHPLAMKVQLSSNCKVNPVIGTTLLVQHVITREGVVIVDICSEPEEKPEEKPEEMTPDSTESCNQRLRSLPFSFLEDRKATLNDTLIAAVSTVNEVSGSDLAEIVAQLCINEESIELETSSVDQTTETLAVISPPKTVDNVAAGSFKGENLSNSDFFLTFRTKESSDSGISKSSNDYVVEASSVENTGPIDLQCIESLDTSGPVDAQFIEPLETTGPVEVQFIEPLESTGPVEVQFIEPLESTGPIEVQFIEPLESTGPVDVQCIEPLESTGPIEVQVIEPLESTGPLDSQCIEPLESTGPVDLQCIDPLESTGPVDLQCIDPLESTGPVDVQFIEPLESTGPIEVQVIEPLESTGPVDLQCIDPLESTGPVDIQCIEPLESTGPADVLCIEPLETNVVEMNINENDRAKLNRSNSHALGSIETFLTDSDCVSSSSLEKTPDTYNATQIVPESGDLYLHEAIAPSSSMMEIDCLRAETVPQVMDGINNSKYSNSLSANATVQNFMLSKEERSPPQENPGGSLDDQFISALDQYPHLGDGGIKDASHTSCFGDTSAMGNIHPYQNTSSPRKITKGRNPLNPFLPPHSQENSPSANSRSSVFKYTSGFASKTLPLKTPNSSQGDFKTILEFELSIIREQNRLQMLELQKEMERSLERSLAIHRKILKEEMDTLRNEVNGKLNIINDSVVHKMAGIYSDVTMLKNDKEMNRDSRSCKSAPLGMNGGQMNKYQSPQPSCNMQHQNAAFRSSHEDSDSYRNTQYYLKGGHKQRDFMGEYQPSANGCNESNGCGSRGMPSNHLAAMHKEKLPQRGGVHLGQSKDHSDRQQSNVFASQSKFNDYPKVDHFDSSKTGFEAEDTNTNKSASGSIVCVMNLVANEITPDRLFNLLGVYGNVLRVKISMQGKVRAYVEMEEPAQAQEAVNHLNNVHLMGQRLHVTRCSFPQLKMARQEFDANTCKDYTKPQLAKLNRFNYVKWDAQKLFSPCPKLLIVNVLSTVTEDKIKEEFAKRGFHIQNISCQQCSNSDKKRVFVTFKSTEEAVNALTVMHLQEFSDWMMVRISFAKNDRKYSDN